jgi:hypothetical protein
MRMPTSSESNTVTFGTLSELYEWALYYHVDFVTEGFEKYLLSSQYSINVHSRCGERKALHEFYKSLIHPIDVNTLKVFDQIVCSLINSFHIYCVLKVSNLDYSYVFILFSVYSNTCSDQRYSKDWVIRIGIHSVEE